MAFPRSSPHSPISREEWNNKSKMSKTTSSHSTAYSVNSSSSRQTSSSIQESSARTYFLELEKYLSFILSKGKREKKNL